MFAIENLNSLHQSEFREARPYPWLNPHGLIAKTEFNELVNNYPDLSLFEHHEDMPREYGQKPHNR